MAYRLRLFDPERNLYGLSLYKKLE